MGPTARSPAPVPAARREEQLAALRLDGEWIDRELASARLVETGAVEYSLERARAAASSALGELDALKESEYLESLRRLPEYVVARWS